MYECKMYRYISKYSPTSRKKNCHRRLPISERARLSNEVWLNHLVSITFIATMVIYVTRTSPTPPFPSTLCAACSIRDSHCTREFYFNNVLSPVRGPTITVICTGVLMRSCSSSSSTSETDKHRLQAGEPLLAKGCHSNLWSWYDLHPSCGATGV